MKSSKEENYRSNFCGWPNKLQRLYLKFQIKCNCQLFYFSKLKQTKCLLNVKAQPNECYNVAYYMLQSRTWAYYIVAFVWPHVAYKAFNFYSMLSFFVESWQKKHWFDRFHSSRGSGRWWKTPDSSGVKPGNGWKEGRNKDFTITLLRN